MSRPRQLVTDTAALLVVGVVGMGPSVGCAETGAAITFDTEGWIDSSPPGTPDLDSTGSGAGEDEDDDEDGEGDFEATWGIFGSYADGALSGLEGEYFAEQGLQELCAYSFAVEVIGAPTDCSECTFAWELELSGSQEEINSNGACMTYGPGSIDAVKLKLGTTSDNRLMRDAGGGWSEVGEVLFEEGDIVLEWPHLAD